MTGPSPYVLDANVFIEAARRYYAFDLAPRFWDSLVQYAANGIVQSIDRVKQELAKGSDQLAEWAKKDFTHAFASTDDADVITFFSEIMRWVQAQSQFSPAAKADFANSADGWLVAYASARGGVVVTEEVAARDVRRRVPIPNICQPFRIPFVDTFQMLRNLGVRFI